MKIQEPGIAMPTSDFLEKLVDSAQGIRDSIWLARTALGWHGQQLPAVCWARGPSDAPEPHCVPDAEVKGHLYAAADLFVVLTGRLAQLLFFLENIST